MRSSLYLPDLHQRIERLHRVELPVRDRSMATSRPLWVHFSGWNSWHSCYNWNSRNIWNGWNSRNSLNMYICSWNSCRVEGDKRKLWNGNPKKVYWKLVIEIVMNQKRWTICTFLQCNEPLSKSFGIKHQGMGPLFFILVHLCDKSIMESFNSFFKMKIKYRVSLAYRFRWFWDNSYPN